MKSVPLHEAESSLSSLVAAAEQGEPTTIIRDGRAVAVLVPVEDARKVYPGLYEGDSDFASFLLRYPGGVDIERDRSTLSDIDL